MFEKFTHLPETELPIYQKRREIDVLFYSAGYLLRVEKQHLNKYLGDTEEWKILKSHASSQLSLPMIWQTDFKPISLHVYLTRLCNLQCAYCFSSPGIADPNFISPSTEAIISGAKMVAENCQAVGVPMTLVCHGGGEPTQHENLLQIVSSIRKICEQKEIPLFTYLATNGVMSKAQANKICKEFDLIGLSCDGPPKIQDQQRPLPDGRGSAPYVEQTASIFRQNGQPFEARVTLTGHSLHHMTSIADYLVETINPRAINVELVYRSSNPPLKKLEINQYLENYFTAQDHCKEAHIPWRTSAIRPKNRHRQYCHMLQNTLQIIPGNVASLCFLDNDCKESSKRQTQIGFYDKKSDKWDIDQHHVTSARNEILLEAEACSDCFVASHCQRSCPEACPLDGNYAPDDDVRCQLNQAILDKHLERAADQLSIYCEVNHTAIAGMEISEC